MKDESVDLIYLAPPFNSSATYNVLFRAPSGNQSRAAKALPRHLSDLQPDHLTKERIRFYMAQRRAERHIVGPADTKRKKPTSDGTIIRERVTLRGALRWARDAKWIANDLPHEVPSAPPGRDRWLTREVANRLQADAIVHHVRVFVAPGLHTAARSEALRELTWSAVDLEAGTIDLGAGHGNKRRSRLMPINGALKPILIEARTGATCPYVIQHGGRPVASIKMGFAAAARRAGLAGIYPNILRHTAVT